MLVVVFPGFHFYRNNGQTVIVVDQEFNFTFLLVIVVEQGETVG